VAYPLARGSGPLLSSLAALGWRAQWKYALYAGTISPLSYVLVL
jgi:hypothetical protein